MMRTAILVLGPALAASPAAASLVTQTLRGSVEAVGDAVGVSVVDPITTEMRFDTSTSSAGF